MKVYFNTKAFDCLNEKNKLNVTSDRSKAELLVMGSKTEEFCKYDNLKAIYRFGVGRENIPDDLQHNNQLKIVFPSETTKNILYESTANFNSYLILYMYYNNTIGSVEKWEKVTRNSLSSKNLLIIGLGNIGKKLKSKMDPLLNVSTFDIIENEYNELKSLIKSADIITIHIPLSDKTINFIDREKLSWIKDNAILVNTSRGKIVDENALYHKIINSNVKAAFDVFWEEPYNGKLKDLGKSKFFMTPHSSSQTIDFVKAGFMDILTIIESFGDER